MKIKIIKPEKSVFEGEIRLAQFPGIDGLFEVLNAHAPMVAALRNGKIRIIDSEEKTHFFEINGGIMEVENNLVLVLAE